MTDSKRSPVRRVAGGIIGAAIGFVIVSWLASSVLLAVIVGCGLGFLIGTRVATSRSWKGGDRADSPYHSSAGKVGRGGGGDMAGG